jgi:triphosphatase
VPAEIELKLALDPSAVSRLERLSRVPAIAATRTGRAKTARVVSTYFDTAGGRLAEEGIALRLRRDGTRWLQTIKGPPLAGAGAGVHARDEYERRLAGPRLDAAHLATTPWHKLLGKLQKRGELVAQFTTDFTRRTLPLAFPEGTRALFSIDVGEIRAARKTTRRVPLSEVEIEVVRGNVQRAFEMALALVDDWPLSVATANKAERGYALARGKPDGWDKPVRAGDVAIPGAASAETALRAVAQECLHQIAANTAGLLHDSDPEWVHQMRIGTRRLRSCLALIAPLAPSGQFEAVIAETKWLAGILGGARDWDVFAQETLPPLATGIAQDPAAVAGLQRLRRRVAVRRRTARAEVQDAVRSRRFQRLVLTLGALIAAPRFGAPEGTDANALGAPAQAFAAHLIARRHRKILKRAESLAEGTAPERHAVRIAAKKLRYAAEFFASLFADKRTTIYLKRLGALQDALGHFNDAATATRLAAELASDHDPATVGAVGGWVAAQAAALRPELDRAWQRFAAAKRFWT